MNIAYYMPFKPMGHKNPSGDLITGTEIYNHLSEKSHSIELASLLRCRWIYYRPRVCLQLLAERKRITTKYREKKPDIWLSYHSYYKAPDLLGAYCSRKLGIPYVIFQGIYSTKRRRNLKSLPGFMLNKKVLLSADHIFTNKKRDYKNLNRILPVNRLTYIPPGINPDDFVFSESSRDVLRTERNPEGRTVIMTAAMFRPGVKTEGISQVIESCAQLVRRGRNVCLWVAGDGQCRKELVTKADKLLPGRVHFLGKIPRKEMHCYYSSADIFAFPGIEESLGMVYLEAQSCNLPVVACRDWGGGEAIVHNETGLLSPAAKPSHFTENLDRLLKDSTLRNYLGENAGEHIRSHHDLNMNYALLEKGLQIQAGSRQTIGR
jgi:glycosyltransferase involved in cell wall biosynthesis